MVPPNSREERTWVASQKPGLPARPASVAWQDYSMSLQPTILTHPFPALSSLHNPRLPTAKGFEKVREQMCQACLLRGSKWGLLWKSHRNVKWFELF